MQDVHDLDGRLVDARGMCLRSKDLLGRGRHVLLLAGAGSAYGTLAAVKHVLDADNLLQLPGGGSQIIVGARLNGQELDASESLRIIEAGARL